MTQVYTVAVADFVVTEVELTPDYTDAGKTFTAYVNVKNIGVVPGDAGTLDVWANRSSAPVPAITVKGDKSVVVGILAAGEEKRIAVIGLSAPKLTTGQTQVACRLQALIDGRAKTLETDETNNARAFDYLAK